MRAVAPPPGFRGLDPDKRITVYTRHLPHWRQQGATYFVTFRLADALPQDKLNELKTLRSHWEYTHPEPRSEADWEEIAREITRRTEAWLADNHGACLFREARWADDLRDRLHHFQGERYHLACWAIMPNHCHAILRPFDGHDLEQLLGQIKGLVARHVHAALGGSGELWQQKSFDRIIRDAEHLDRVIQYIGRNPEKANLPRHQWYRWIDPAGWPGLEPLWAKPRSVGELPVMELTAGPQANVAQLPTTGASRWSSPGHPTAGRSKASGLFGRRRDRVFQFQNWPTLRRPIITPLPRPIFHFGVRRLDTAFLFFFAAGR